MVREEPQWEPWIRDGELEYEVQDILDCCGRGPTREYLIHWKGQSREEAMWEPLSSLTNCQNKLRAFALTRRRRQRSQTAQPTSRGDFSSTGEEVAASRLDSGEAAQSQALLQESTQDDETMKTTLDKVIE